MHNMQDEFIDFLIQYKALQFGDFTLKSGRKSPYFFNLGSFHTGSALTKLGEFYAETLIRSELHYDILFGPAYKGIPLVTATVIALSEKFHIDAPYCFNRKEKKSYGDGGTFVGAPVKGNVVMLDDVITAGITIQETITNLQTTGAKLSGVVIALDRQERGTGKLSAVQEAVKTHHIPVQSIITLSDIIQYLSKHKKLHTELKAVENYRAQFNTI